MIETLSAITLSPEGVVELLADVGASLGVVVLALMGFVLLISLAEPRLRRSREKGGDPKDAH